MSKKIKVPERFLPEFETFKNRPEHVGMHEDRLLNKFEGEVLSKDEDYKVFQKSVFSINDLIELKVVNPENLPDIEKLKNFSKNNR